MFFTGWLFDFTPTQVRVIKPSTLLTARDLGGSFIPGADGLLFESLLAMGNTTSTQIQLKDMEIEWEYDGAHECLEVDGGDFSMTRVLVDHDRMSGARSRDLVDAIGQENFSVTDCSVLNIAGAGTSAFYMVVSGYTAALRGFMVNGVNASLARRTSGFPVSIWKTSEIPSSRRSITASCSP